jgi:hypothetical protein
VEGANQRIRDRLSVAPAACPELVEGPAGRPARTSKISDRWPTQAVLWLEWGSSKAKELRRRRSFLNRIGRGTNDINHHVRVRKHGNMAAGDLSRGSAHPLREEALQIRMHRVLGW